MESGQKKKVQMGVELGGFFIESIAKFMTILRFWDVYIQLSSSGTPFEGA